ADRIAARVASANERLGVAVARLEALSPLRVLARGYAIVTKEGEASPVTDAEALIPGDSVRLRLARGRAAARILSTETE
ncbi:MAG TPA: exodeoxyribonuclease VII large subunit, partial [Thermoanaerobaculia bacterium]|nr:exodeoxyribonuclease VII large subunit [Thermoanaerobaculia bacterium]